MHLEHESLEISYCVWACVCVRARVFVCVVSVCCVCVVCVCRVCCVCCSAGPLDNSGQLRGGKFGSRVVTENELVAMVREIEREDLINIFTVGACLCACLSVLSTCPVYLSCPVLSVCLTVLSCLSTCLPGCLCLPGCSKRLGLSIGMGMVAYVYLVTTVARVSLSV